MGHPLGRLALLHPFPSTLNACLVAAVSTVAGASVGVALALAGAMLGFQVSIGALNDLADAPEDAMVKPAKPIPSGAVSSAAAGRVVVGGAIVASLLAALVSPAALVLGLAGYACGVAYDLWLKRRGLGPLAFAAAFPLLLLFAWTGATGALPPAWMTLLPVAALAGPALQLANALTDLDHDRTAGIDGLALRLGRGRAVGLLALLLLVVHGLAWRTLLSMDGATAPSLVLAALASALALVGVLGSAHGGFRAAAWGWSLQAVSISLLAVAWLAAAVA